MVKYVRNVKITGSIDYDSFDLDIEEPGVVTIDLINDRVILQSSPCGKKHILNCGASFSNATIQVYEKRKEI